MRELIAGYEIIGAIGHGGLATVYRARDLERQRDVALKLLRREYLTDLGFRARFEREGAVITALEHKAIVPVYEVGQYEEQLYIVMAYMPHGSLAERLQQGPLPVQLATGILARIGAALDYAHSQGVIHRDLKPSNILFDAEDQAYLADFGIARQAQADEPGGVAISGTPAYMSPEQARHDAMITGASDVYALGVTAYQMVTGRLPFTAQTPVAILMQHIHESPPAPRDVNPELSPGVEPVLLKALSKDPDRRHGTATAFVTALQKAMQGDPGRGVRSMAAVITPEAAVAALKASMGLAATVGGPQPEPAQSVAPEESKGGVVGLPVRVREQIESRWEELQSRLTARPALAFALVTLLAVICALLAVLALRGPALITALRPESPAEAEELAGLASSATSPASIYLPFAPLQRGLVTPTATPAPTPTTPADNVRMLYGDGVVTLINISDGHVSLSELALRRVTSDGSISPSFGAGQWRRVAGAAISALPAGDCLQLLSTDSAANGGPKKPAECDTLRGWLATRETDPLFQGLQEGDLFQVLLNDELLQTCAVVEGNCHFTVPQP